MIDELWPWAVAIGKAVCWFGAVLAIVAVWSTREH